MTITITTTTGAQPPGKLADAELHFDSTSDRRNVTFPARSYSVNGERRTFALLRPLANGAELRLRADILQAYAEYERSGQQAGAADARPSEGWGF